MSRINGKNIYLRSLEADDIDFLYQIENDKRFWVLSDTRFPYSRNDLINYISNAKQAIDKVGQYRFVICNEMNQSVGFIDLFDYNAIHKRAGIGLIIAPEFQHKGYGKAALACLVDYAIETLKLTSLIANVLINNPISMRLFEGQEFKKIRVKKKWIRLEKSYIDEIKYKLTSS